MEEPFASLNQAGQELEAIQADLQTSPEDAYYDAKSWLWRLERIEEKGYDLPVDWQQYIASLEASFNHIAVQAKQVLPTKTLHQIDLKLHADRAVDRHTDAQLERQERYQLQNKRKLFFISAGAIGIIILIVGLIFFYQWRLFMGDESWFRDVGEERWSALEKRIGLGKPIETRDHKGRTGWLVAANASSLESLKKWKDLGSNIRARDRYGNTALHHAAGRGKPEMIHWLLKQGLEIDATNQEGLTPLHLLFRKSAGNRESEKAANLLIEQGANVSGANPEESIFMAAILWVRGAYFERPNDILEALVAKGVDINHKGANGATALTNSLAKYLPTEPDPKLISETDTLVKFLLDSGATYEKRGFDTFESTLEEEKKLQFSPGIQ
ncbi:MAG: ankyrin repeat domain-containing protein [Verrucomicrobiota bacterium]